MRRIRFILLPLLLLLAGHAMADNVTVANIEAKAGESAEIVVNFATTTTNLTGYQMSLYLPDGITLQKDQDGDYIYELSSRHNRNHVFSVNEQADGGLLLVCYSPTKKTIAAGSGELLRLPVDIAATATGTLTADFKTIKFSDTGSVVTQLNNVSFAVTIVGGITPPTPPSCFSLYPAEFSVRKGDADVMSIMLDNEEPVIMAEFYMQLPAGLSIVTDEDDYLDATLNTGRVDRTHTLEVSLGSDGLYHFLAYSSKNKAFTDNTGELVCVRISCDESIEAGSYQGLLKSVLLSDANKQAIELGDLTFTIEVTDYILGDVNDDRRINGMDIVEIVDLIMSQGYSKAADLYPAGRPDGIVNGMDLVEEVDMVMSQTAITGTQARMMKNYANGLTLTPQNGGAFALGVMTGQHYLMTQCTVQLSDGMCLDDVTTDEHHTAAWKKTGENTYMVVAYSGRNRVFASNDALLSLHCTGEGTVSVTNVLMADENRQERHFAAVSAGTTTGISATLTNGKKMNSEKIYDLQGRRIGSKVRPGVYVVGGQKKMVK